MPSLQFWRVGQLRIGLERWRIDPHRHHVTVMHIGTGRLFGANLTTAELAGLAETISLHLGQQSQPVKAG